MPIDRSATSVSGVGLGLIRLAAFLIRNARPVLWPAFGLGLLGLGASLMRRPSYRATAAFTPSLPESRGPLASLGGLASQLGLGVGVAGPDPAAFYAALLRSRQVLDRVVSDTYRVSDGHGGVLVGNLEQLLTEQKYSDPTSRLKTIERVREHLAVAFNSQTDIVEIKVEAPEPDLAEQVATRLLKEINDFDLQRRQLQATNDRVFFASRTAAAESSLASAELALASFLKRNRQYQNAPELVLEHDRLVRRVDFRQEVLTSLVQNLERMKIEEIRNTPVIVPIDLPRGSAAPRPRSVLLNVALGLFFGGLAGIGFSWARDSVRGEREHNPAEYAAVRQFGAKVFDGLRRLILRRRVTSVGSKDSR